jgi:hypothetical protein
MGISTNPETPQPQPDAQGEQPSAPATERRPLIVEPVQNKAPETLTFERGDHVIIDVDGALQFGWRVATEAGPNDTVDVIRGHHDTQHRYVSMEELIALNKPARPEEIYEATSAIDLLSALTRTRGVLHLSDGKHHGWKLVEGVERVLQGKEHQRLLPKELRGVLKRLQ